MGEVVAVVADGVEFHAEVATSDGAADVGLDDVLLFDCAAHGRGDLG